MTKYFFTAHAKITFGVIPKNQFLPFALCRVKFGINTKEKK